MSATHPATRRAATSGPIDWLTCAAARRPDHPAVVTAERQLTYADLERRATQRAGQLVHAGLEPGRRVALWMPNALAWVELAHAIPRLGVALVPLHPRLSAREVEPMLEDARPGLIVHAPALEPAAREAAARLGIPHVTPEALARHPAAPAPAPPAFAPAEPHAILFTSGTTGRPKGVPLGAAQQEASARASAEHLGQSDDDRWLLCMPLHHVGGLAIVVRSVLHATTLVLQERFDAQAALHTLHHDAITHVSLVPTMLARLLELEAEAPPGLRCVLLGGGPIDPSLVARARARGWPLSATYGLTEAASQVATSPPGDPELGWLPPLPGTHLRVVDLRGRDVPTGCEGEIWVRGPQVMPGYLARAGDASGVTKDGWLRTGDVGVLDARGRLRVLDRRSDLIVSGGENVYPADVEATLQSHPGVAEAGVIGEPDAHWGQRVVAVVVPRSERPDPALAAELEALCARELASFKRPRRLVLRFEPLPRTASGKLRRGTLREWIQT